MNPSQTIRETRKVYSVSEVNRLARTVLESEVGEVWIEGELSRVVKSQPGHLYFNLKDENAVISGAMFRGSQRGLRVDLRDGLKVRAYGRLTVYEPRGNYQVVVTRIEEAGAGDLQKAFEELKKKLGEEGLFEAARKKPMPLLPQRIGVVTSPTGAALRDIVNVLTRRFPNIHVLLAPVQVQGAGSAEQIAEAIDLMNRLAEVDVMIVGRGGGSMEDLWSFNEECVARAMARSSIPVISAVGHEIDFTISDFVADLRAPTPSAAAELVVGQKDVFEQRLDQLRSNLARALQARALEIKNRVTAAQSSYVFREPANLVRHARERLRGLLRTLVHENQARLRKEQQRVDELGLRLRHRMDVRTGTCRQDLRRLASQLQALSPVAVIERGYSVTRDAKGKIIRSIDEVREGDAICTELAQGFVDASVTATRKRKSNG